MFAAKDLDSYSELGFAVVRRLFEPQTVEAIFNEITAVAAAYPDTPEELIQFEPGVKSGRQSAPSVELSIRKLFRVAKHNDFFRELAYHPRMLGFARQILGQRLQLVQTMLLMKSPEVNTIKVWHQDNAYFRYSPPDMMGFWVACDSTDAANGCMHVVPRSHQGGLKEHAGDGDEYGLVEKPSLEDVVPVPLEPGDALLFHGELFHFTPENKTKRRRRSLQYHYAARNAQPQSAGHWFSAEPEIEEMD